MPAGGQAVWHHYSLDPAKLLTGRNFLAVSVHQATTTEAALFFDLQLIGVIGSLPEVFMQTSGEDLQLRWSSAHNGWHMERSENLRTWTAVPELPVVEGPWTYLIQPSWEQRAFFRLVRD